MIISLPRPFLLETNNQTTAKQSASETTDPETESGELEVEIAVSRKRSSMKQYNVAQLMQQCLVLLSTIN